MRRLLLLSIDFGHDGNAGGFLGTGWSHDESGFAWAVGPESSLIVDAPCGQNGLVVQLDVQPHVNPPTIPLQTLTVLVNGEAVGSVDLTAGAIVECQVPAELVARSNRMVLTFQHPCAAQPLEAGQPTADRRRLAFAFRHCRLFVPPTRSNERHAPVAEDTIDLVFLDDAVLAEGVPANFKNVVGYVQVSPLVKHLEFTSLRSRFRHRRLSEIGDDPGYLVIGLFGSPVSWLGRTADPALHDRLPELQAILDTHRGLKLLLDYSWEAGLGAGFLPLIDEFLLGLRVDPARVVLLMANSGIEARYQHYRRLKQDAAGGASRPGFTVIGLDLFLLYSAVEFARHRWFGSSDSLIEAAEVEAMARSRRPRKIMSLNRRPRWHRFLLAMMIRQLGLREDAIISMPSPAYEGDWTPELQHLERYGSTMAPRLWPTLAAGRDATLASLPWSIDVDVDHSGHTSAFAYQNSVRQPYLDSYFHVVTESYFEGDPGDMFLTEKTCKAIVGLQPFIVFGHAASLRTLERHGFALPRFIDHAYDEMPAIGPRLDALYRALARIASWTADDAHEVYYANLRATLHNREQLMRMPQVLAPSLLERLRAALAGS